MDPTPIGYREGSWPRLACSTSCSFFRWAPVWLGASRDWRPRSPWPCLRSTSRCLTRYVKTGCFKPSACSPSWRGAGSGEDRRYDALFGLLIGLATGIKFTGLLLVPSYLAARMLAPGRRVARHLCWPGPSLSRPLPLRRLTRSCTLRRTSPGPPRAPGGLLPGGPHGRRRAPVGSFGGGDGAGRSGLSEPCWPALGIVMALRSAWRSWLPPLLHPVATILVLSTGHLVFGRYILPAMGIVHLMVGVGVQGLARVHGLVAFALAGLMALTPARMCLRYAWVLSRPSAQDQALDWILSNVPAGARIVETRPDATPGGNPGTMVGIPKDRYELLPELSPEDRRAVAAARLPHGPRDRRPEGRRPMGAKPGNALCRPRSEGRSHLQPDGDARSPEATLPGRGPSSGADHHLGQPPSPGGALGRGPRNLMEQRLRSHGKGLDPGRVRRAFVDRASRAGRSRLSGEASSPTSRF